MRHVDINRKYRMVAVFCAMHGGKDGTRVMIPWETLEEKFGISWETYTHELTVNGMLFGTTGYVYLRPTWVNMTIKERMEAIKTMYPYPHQQ